MESAVVPADQWWVWLCFIAVVLLMLSVDLYGFAGGKAHRVKYKEAIAWYAVWFFLAILFSIALWAYLYYTKNPDFANQKFLEFITGYIIELSLSVDNLFVFLLIFNYFAIPAEFQRRALLYGIMGAIVLRLTMILAGLWLISMFHWLLYLLGALLIYSGLKMLFTPNIMPDWNNHLALKTIKKYLNVTDEFYGERFFIRKNNVRYATPLFLALVLIEISDIIFALDSIPAILTITQDAFIIFTSNVFAILGLRSIYFILTILADKFTYLKYGISIILAFIGFKMILSYWYILPIAFTLSVIILVLLGSMLFSRFARNRD